jgi:Kef-type K+ transport system membrane component KefB
MLFGPELQAAQTLAITTVHANEVLLVKVLVQLAVIIGFARIMAVLVRRIGQPAAVGETIAGLLLGPSLFGWLAPQWSATVFDPALADGFNIIKDLGLVLLLFLIGLEFDFSHLRSRSGVAGFISLSGVLVPFTLGCLLATLIHPRVAPEVPRLGFTLFLGVSMSITALPMLGRILIELNMTRSRLGTIAITAAAVDDAMGWTLLAAVAALVRANFSIASTAIMIAETVVMALVMLFVARPLLLRWIRSSMEKNGGDLGLPAMTVILVLVMACAVATATIGIFAVFGAFLLGASLSSDRQFHAAMTRRMSDFVTVFFLPIFFAYTGLRTDIGSIGSASMLSVALAIFATAIAGKFGGCTLAAKLGGLNWRQSACIGVLMNTRGLMELIVINIGYELGVVPKPLFCMLVMMALLTTIMTTPLMLWLGRREPELRPLLAESNFRAWVGGAS